MYFDAGLEFDLNNHQIHAGVKYYGPDYVFVSNTVGASLAYNYPFTRGNWYCGPGAGISFFHENKSAGEVYVTELLLKNTIGYEIADHFALYSHIGVGTVINKYRHDILNTTGVTSYVNYEFSLGIKYYWSTRSDN